MRKLIQRLKARQGLLNQLAFGVNSLDLFAQKDIDIPNFNKKYNDIPQVMNNTAYNSDMIEIENDWKAVGECLMNASIVVLGDNSVRTK